MSEIVVAGERLELFAERAAHWGAARTLLVADPHFGKAAAFRAAGVFVPEATTVGALERLDALLERSQPERVVFLGDFLHAREGRHPETLATLNEWRDRHAALEIIVVRGNHDRHAGDPPRELRMRCEDGPVVDGPFAFAHHPVRSTAGYVIAGHIHPAVRLYGAGLQRERLRCFWFRNDSAVLPAFGEFTGVADIEPSAGDHVYVIADDRVEKMG